MVNIKWDFTNWLTVILMVAVGYVAFGAVRSVIVGRSSATADA